MAGLPIEKHRRPPKSAWFGSRPPRLCAFDETNRRPPRYDEQQIQASLMEVAIAGGNRAEACRWLLNCDDPLPFPESTLKLGCNQRPAHLWERIRPKFPAASGTTSPSRPRTTRGE